MSDGFYSFSPQTPFIKCQFIFKSWKSGNFSRFYLGKMEIFGQKVLEKWKFLMISPWKSGNFQPKKLGKVEILKEICLKKWK